MKIIKFLVSIYLLYLWFFVFAPALGYPSNFIITVLGIILIGMWRAMPPEKARHNYEEWQKWVEQTEEEKRQLP